MPENVLPQPNSAPKVPPSSTLPGGTASSATPSAEAATGAAPTSPTSVEPYRYPANENVPEWARGKTAAEVLSVAQGALNAFGRPAAGTAMPASAAPQAPVSTQGIDDDAILTGRDAKRLFEQFVSPSLANNVENTAANSLAVARSTHAKDFERYGPEITQELAKVPKQYWTLDNVETVVTLIRGRHRDEYARELASQLAANMEPTIRPTGGGSGPVTTQPSAQNPFEGEHVPAEWRIRAKNAGINERTIQEFCQANDMSPEDFWKQFERSPMQPIVAEVSARGQ